MSADTRRQQRQFHRQTVENENILVCLISKPFEENEASELEQLTQNNIYQFSDVDFCIDFVTDRFTQKKLYWIVDDIFAKNVIPLFHDAPNLESIYILGDIYEGNDWTNECSKIKNITSSLESIKNMIEKQMTVNERKLVSISIFASTSINHSSFSIAIDQLDPAFMYSQLLKDIIIDTKFSQRDKEQFFDFVRKRHAANNATLKVIKNLEQNYKQYSPAWWYSLESFIYRDINKAFRLQEVDVAWKFGFFIKDLHEQLVSLLTNMRPENRPKKVWRDQSMSNEEFEKLKSNSGGLISFNNFLSTSAEQDIPHGLAFAALGNPANKAVLIEIDLSSTTEEQRSMNCVFASVKEYSHMKDEDEVLFSMHTIFRIKSIVALSTGINHIVLTLTNDNDEELRNVTEYLRYDIGLRQKGLPQLCTLMGLMGDVAKAIEIGEVVLNQTPENDFKGLANIYNELGRLCTSAKYYNKALEYYESMDKIISDHYPNILDRVLPRALIFANKARVIHLHGNDEKGEKRMAIYNEALECFQPFLDLVNMTDLIDYDDLTPDVFRTFAVNFNNIGLLYRDREHELDSPVQNYSNALAMFEKAREFYEKCEMPTICPDFALLLNNIALIQIEMDQMQEALTNLQNCLRMQERVLPSTEHPSIASTCYNLSGCFIVLDQLNDAKRYAERAVKIARQHSDLELEDYQKLINVIETLQSDCKDSIDVRNLFQTLFIKGPET